MPLYICEIIFCRICNRYCYTILAIALWYLLSLTNCLFGLFSLQIVQNLMFLLRCLKIFITDFSVWRGIVFPKCVACFKNFFYFYFIIIWTETLIWNYFRKNSFYSECRLTSWALCVNSIKMVLCMHRMYLSLSASKFYFSFTSIVNM